MTEIQVLRLFQYRQYFFLYFSFYSMTEIQVLRHKRASSNLLSITVLFYDRDTGIETRLRLRQNSLHR